MAEMTIFQNDAFRAATLTTALNRRPHKPGFLGAQGLFTPKPVRTITVGVESQGGKLALIQTSERGAPLVAADVNKRDVRDFRTVRIAKQDTIHAHELQSIRAFGSTSELQQVQAEVAQRLANLQDDVDLTHEYMMLGAIQGIVLDADGSVIRNWYTEFGIAQPAEFDFELDDPTTDVRGKCTAVVRAVQRAAQGGGREAAQRLRGGGAGDVDAEAGRAAEDRFERGAGLDLEIGEEHQHHRLRRCWGKANLDSVAAEPADPLRRNHSSSALI